MNRYILSFFTLFIFLGCADKTGISAKYYANECSEFYDVQGYYHKDCKNDNIITYKEIGEKVSKAVDFVTGKEEKKDVEKPKGNVW